jgi:hypothetical protein
MNDRIKFIDPIQLKYGLFFILRLDHQIHVVCNFSRNFRYSIGMGTAFDSCDGARACFGEMLFWFDPAGMPGLVDDWD